MRHLFYASFLLISFSSLAAPSDVKWKVIVSEGEAGKNAKDYNVEMKSIQIPLSGSKWICNTQRGEQDGRSAVGVVCKSGDLIAMTSCICSEVSQAFAMTIASGSAIHSFGISCVLPIPPKKK